MKVVCALENGPGIPFVKIFICKFLLKNLKKKKKKRWKFWPKMKKKMRRHEKNEKIWKNGKKWGVDSLK